MFHKPKISVIIPAFNSEEYIQKAFESVRDQTLKEIEIVLVDDGSTDKTATLLQHYKMEDNRVVVITHQNNKGLGAARNSAIKQAAGEYLFFLDSDDSIFPDALQVMYQKSKTANLDILQAQFVKNDPNEICPKDLVTFEQAISGISYYNSGIFIEPKACVKLWKREFIKQHNLQFSNTYYEDIVMVLKAFVVARYVNNISVPVYHYVHRSNSITGQAVTRKHVADYRQVLNELQILFKNPEINCSTSVFPSIFMLFLVNLCSMVIALNDKALCKEIRGFEKQILKKNGKYMRKNKRLSFVKRHFVTRKPCWYAKLKKIKKQS